MFEIILPSFFNAQNFENIFCYAEALPSAVFGLLIIYCLKSVNVFEFSHGLPELISILLVVIIHLWQRKMLLSIASGTICYMLLVQTVF